MTPHPADLKSGSDRIGPGRAGRPAGPLGGPVDGLRPYTRGVDIGPAPVLALLVGGFHTALFVAIRRTVDARVAIAFLAAVLGAWAGDATGGRLGIDPVRIGDFHLITASIVAWAGIGFVFVLSILGPESPEEHRL